MRGYEPIVVHEYLHLVDELHQKMKEEIHNIQDPLAEVINKYVVGIAYATTQLSMFISKMIKSASGTFEAKVGCECDEKNIRIVQLEYVMQKY